MKLLSNMEILSVEKKLVVKCYMTLKEIAFIPLKKYTMAIKIKWYKYDIWRNYFDSEWFDIDIEFRYIDEMAIRIYNSRLTCNISWVHS